MPVFKFTQREVTTHTIIVRADNEEEASEFVGELCDDDFPNSDTDWEDTECEDLDEGDATVDEDISNVD